MSTRDLATRRSTQQNRALHKYLTMLADALNDAGLDVQHTLSKPLELPWNERLAKELVWRQVQIACTGKESTTELDTREVDEVYRIIDRHMAQTHGISVAFPSWND